jgi:hypothetical protein
MGRSCHGRAITRQTREQTAHRVGLPFTATARGGDNAPVQSVAMARRLRAPLACSSAATGARSAARLAARSVRTARAVAATLGCLLTVMSALSLMSRPVSQGSPLAADTGLPDPPERAGDVHDGIASVQPLDRLAALMCRKFAWSPESQAAHLRSLPAFPGPGFDERALEFGEAPQDRQHQHPMRRRGVAPTIIERTEASAGLLHSFQDIQQVAGRARQAVQPGHHRHVPRLEPLDHPGKIGSIAARAARLLGKYLDAPCGSKLGDLAGEVLFAGTDTGISEVQQVTIFCSTIYATINLRIFRFK